MFSFSQVRDLADVTLINKQKELVLYTVLNLFLCNVIFYEFYQFIS